LCICVVGCVPTEIFAQKKQSLQALELNYYVCPHYKTRPDGQPGREVLLFADGIKALKNIRLDIGNVETLTVSAALSDTLSILLPPETGVSESAKLQVRLTAGKTVAVRTLEIPAMRHWTVYIYPHSHVDIGYTNTQANVEIIHTRNLLNGMKLAAETADFPEGARYVWNPEALWPVERYLSKASAEQKEELLDAVRKGYLCLDAGYVHTNTSAASGEELFEFLQYGKSLETLTGQRIETLVQVDIPGMSWGVVPVAAQLQIPYILCLFNGSDRTGNSPDISFKPFWWLSPDGKSKALFLQPGSYNPGALVKGKYFWPQLAGQTDPEKLLQIVKTDNPRDNFIDSYLFSKLPELEQDKDYPYDIFPMSWAMADNTPIDADLPEAVKSWNEEFAFPHLIICSATQTMRAFDERYGANIPTLSGDFTEYWTDGLGSSARHTAMNRNVKERLTQTETLWSMLHPSQPFPRAKMDEAWRNVILGTEHTWAFMNPDKQPISNDILKVKLGYFETGERLSRELLQETLPKANNSHTLAVFNTQSWAHGGLVTVSEAESRGFNGVKDLETGKPVLAQRLSTGELLFWADDIPPLGCRKYELQKNAVKTKTSFIQGNTLDNGIVRVTVDEQTGDVTSIIYSSNEFVDNKSVSAVNSYRYLHGDDSPGRAVKAFNNRLTIKENGPLIATLAVESEAEGCASLVREVSIVAGQPFIELSNTLDKKAITAKEGVHFGFAFNIPAPTLKADIPWGVMEVEKEQLKAGNRNWIAFQRWLNISGEDKSVTWCALDACMFECGDITANILGSASGSPKWIRTLKPDATVYSWALNNHWHTNFALSQEGMLTFRYRILPQNSSYDPSTANRFGTEQIQPLIVAAVDADFEFTHSLSVVSDDESVVLSVCKPSADGKSCVIRLRSVADKNGEASLQWQTHKPKALYINRNGENYPAPEKITVPAKGFVTLLAEWE